MNFNKILFFALFFMIDGRISGKKSMSEKLLNRYHNVVNVCYDRKKNPKPAFECSGLVIRGIRKNKGGLQYAWSLKDRSKEQNSFSFAFLRHDQFFDRFPRDYEAGFILYPRFDIPEQKSTYKVHCAFPIDAGTDARAGHGCGKRIPNGSDSSKDCDELQITTLKKWIDHSERFIANGDLVGKQCGFDMTLNTAARDFTIVAEANEYIRRHTSKLRNNELRIEAWNENEPEKLPIQVFFYITTSFGGYNAARSYRDDYRRLTHEDVPIVGIKLPTTNEGKLTIINSDLCGMPIENHIISVHNMRSFDVYGAFIRKQGQSDSDFRTKEISPNHREYYVLKDGEYEAHKINGLPNDALILSIHNLGGVNYFGSKSGAYKLVQGQLSAHKVPGVNHRVDRVILGGSSNPDDAKFY